MRRFVPPARWRRPLMWGLLIALLAVAQALLVFLALQYESSRAQERAETVALAAAEEARRVFTGDLPRLQLLTLSDTATPEPWRRDVEALLRERRELVRVERRDADFRLGEVVRSSHNADLLPTPQARVAQSNEAEAACAAARRSGAPTFSRSYFVPLASGGGHEVIDVCLPAPTREPARDSMVVTIALAPVLEAALVADSSRAHELSFVEADGARLARAGRVRGIGVYRAERVVDLPGSALLLRADSSEGRPALIPNLSVALVVGLSLLLTGLVVLLGRDVRRRAAAERGLAEALAFRRAMEDSLVTGLRARDLEGRITYVNPAFCRMVGFTAEEMMRAGEPPYWPPERATEYAARQAQRQAATRPDAPEAVDPRVGYETLFMRKNGERFPVMIYEAPLVDGQGRHTGWMSAAVDLTEQRRVEELSRQQQERLQATARLATVGEMASLLSHELNQPLAAIASYANGSLNLLDAPDTPAAGEQALQVEDKVMLRQALARIAEQADRAGRTIKSVHDFVRRREHAQESLSAAALVDAVLPLVRLQARKSGTRIEVEMPSPAPRVWADRTMVEQVLLNLTRNGIQSMEGEATPLVQRVLRIGVQPQDERVQFSVADAGPGIAPEVAARLFTPFFTTRREGMGLGLSLCRTVVEQHGGALDFASTPRGSTFRFTLRAAP